MQSFVYSNSPYPIRDDLPEAYRCAWQKISEPGNWWTGAQRVAIAAEVRNALACAFCEQRKAALSPAAPLPGTHHSTTDLPAVAVDAVHRLTTDASRLSKPWLEQVLCAEFTPGHYVEALGVVVAVMSIDSFHRALGFELEPLPEPRDGQPSHYEPPGLERETAWVPLIEQPGEREQDLWQGQIGNVIRAMSLVPDAVRLLKTLSAAQYIPIRDVPNPAADGGRALSRSQIEFIAARVSAINDCFY